MSWYPWSLGSSSVQHSTHCAANLFSKKKKCWKLEKLDWFQIKQSQYEQLFPEEMMSFSPSLLSLGTKGLLGADHQWEHRKKWVGSGSCAWSYWQLVATSYMGWNISRIWACWSLSHKVCSGKTPGYPHAEKLKGIVMQKQEDEAVRKKELSPVRQAWTLLGPHINASS